MKISEMSEDAAKQYLFDSYQSAVQAHGRGELTGKHPSHQVISWSRLGGGGNGNNIEDEELPGDPSTPGGSRSGGKTAIDGHFQLGMDSVPRFFKRDGTVVIGSEALVLRARQNGDGRANASVIPGYDRLK